MDQKWEDERYRKSLECVRIENNEEIPFILESQKMRREGDDQLQERGAKRRKRENGGVVWGEKVDEDQRRKNQFLGSEMSTTTKKNTQPKINVLTGTDWMVYLLRS